VKDARVLDGLRELFFRFQDEHLSCRLSRFDV
jgi:hypothetical protein